MTRDHIVVLKDLVKKYDDQTILDGINLSFVRGETTVIIGGSGAGKTTLIRHIVGLEKPTSGHVFIDGEDIVPLGDTELNRVRRKLGMVYQYAALLDSINVFDNVAFPLVEHTKLSGKEIRERVMDKLRILGLDDSAAKKYPSELSGGMRKRVGLARALMLEPPILVYDEPTSGLDPLSSRMVDDLIKETRERFGVTSVVISHDMASALRIADYIFLISKGRMMGEGTPNELASGENDLANQFLESSCIATDKLLRERNG
jgi:phospholipid/cholesterol/gamma-HCH transport system ATP-binding protein